MMGSLSLSILSPPLEDLEDLGWVSIIFSSLEGPVAVNTIGVVFAGGGIARGASLKEKGS